METNQEVEENTDTTISGEGMDLLAQILTASVQHSQSASNSVENGLQGYAEDWRDRFNALYDSVQRAAKRTDSHALHMIADGFHYERYGQGNKLYWEDRDNGTY